MAQHTRFLTVPTGSHRFAFDRILGQPRLNGLKQRAIEDRFVFAWVNLATIGDLADVEPVLEQMGERADPIASSSEQTPIR